MSLFTTFNVAFRDDFAEKGITSHGYKIAIKDFVQLKHIKLGIKTERNITLINYCYRTLIGIVNDCFHTGTSNILLTNRGVSQRNVCKRLSIQPNR